MKTSFRRFSLSLLTLLGLTFSLVGVTSVHAVGAVVTNANDSGTGSLRQAIIDAGVGDTITFDASLSGGTIYLASTLILTKNVSIDGSSLASRITLSGDTDNNGTSDVRVLQVSPGVTVVLDTLAITHGKSPIYSGTVNVRGGIGGGGGGIDNEGTLTVANSTLSGNFANYGAGIVNIGTLTVINSTLAGNSAGWGGGIENERVLTITNSTLSGNAASSYGGGIYNSGTLNYANTIIANSPAGGDCSNTGTLGTNIKNLVEDGSCSASLSGDPRLGPLANNGGPTPTFALLAGSSAIDAGDDAICAAAPVNNLDQRGNTRPVGAHCDIGSYEAPFTMTLTSIAAQDGWVLESSENSNAGGMLDSTANTLKLGDNVTGKQYRSILSFNTSSIPDSATITRVTLKVKQQSIVGGGNPVAIFKGFMVDIKNGIFGTSALQIADFQTAASQILGPVEVTLISGIYSINLTAGKGFINKLALNSGLTQIRLRFKLDDNNNAIANYLNLYSGSAAAANRPQLVITYMP